MLTRRRFLGGTGIGIISMAHCRPPIASADSPPASQDPFVQRYASFRKNKDKLLGYPINLRNPAPDFFRWRNELASAGLNHHASNNVGDPFQHSSIAFNSHELEKKAILFFGRLHAFPQENVWGFVSNSGTDSNMHGMYMGRTILQHRTGKIPKVYFTREAHYSIQILSDLLGLDAVTIRTKPDGSMDVEHLAQEIKQHDSYPALVVGTVGTTFKGAIDPVNAIRKCLDRRTSYFHVDAALFGGFLPHLDQAELVQYHNSAPNGKFDSIAISCHKFFGFPAPAGLYLTTADLFREFKLPYSRIHDPEYIHHIPGTITCSRDAVKPAEFFYHTTAGAQKRLAEDARLILKNTDYLHEELKRDFAHLSPQRSCNHSNTVYFRHPGEAVVREFSLATMHIQWNGKREHFAHAVVMPHTSELILEQFLRRLPRS